MLPSATRQGAGQDVRAVRYVVAGGVERQQIILLSVVLRAAPLAVMGSGIGSIPYPPRSCRGPTPPLAAPFQRRFSSRAYVHTESFVRGVTEEEKKNGRVYMTVRLRIMLAATLAVAGLGALTLTTAPGPAHAAALVADCQPGAISSSEGVVYICNNAGHWVRL